MAGETRNSGTVGDGKDLVDQVDAVASSVLGGGEVKLYNAEVALDLDFVRSCFEANERGDGLLLAALIRGKFLYVNSPDGVGEWYVWDGSVWQPDEDHLLVDVADMVAQAYEEYAWDIDNQKKAIIDKALAARETKIAEIKQQYDADEATEKIDTLLKKDIETPKWMPTTIKQYHKRAWTLRARERILKSMFFAPKVDRSISTRASLLDQKPNLLPALNGVIDLDRGILVPGRPEDLLTKRVDVEYDSTIDYQPWVEVLEDICIHPSWHGSEEMPDFLQRFFGYCASGYINEEILVVFYGPGRNGKGTIIETVTTVLGSYFHKVNRTLFTEQRNEPSPSAASEHMAAMQGKRLCVGAETNKHQKIDGGRVKDITGGNKINFRKNFGSENTYTATHKLILETNNILKGLTAEFSLKERLVFIDFFWRFVDDPEEAEKKTPALKGRFKKKDKTLKEKLKTPEFQRMVLKWMVDGYRKWKEEGLSIPACCIAARSNLESNENTLQRFVQEVLVSVPLDADGAGEKLRIPLTKLYDTIFRWWWDENMDASSKIHHKNSLSAYLEENGYDKRKTGGTIYIYQVNINEEFMAALGEKYFVAEPYK